MMPARGRRLKMRNGNHVCEHCDGYSRLKRWCAKCQELCWLCAKCKRWQDSRLLAIVRLLVNDANRGAQLPKQSELSRVGKRRGVLADGH